MEQRKYYSQRFWIHLLSMPFIWTPLPFLIMLDIVGELYHQLCFPLYGIKKVRRREYIQIFDRAKLQYLNPFEKVACMYCGYANGLLLYFKEVAGRTELYWCGIMHESKPGFKTHMDQAKRKFTKFGDKKGFHRKYPKR